MKLRRYGHIHEDFDDFSVSPATQALMDIQSTGSELTNLIIRGITNKAQNIQSQISDIFNSGSYSKLKRNLGIENASPEEIVDVANETIAELDRIRKVVESVIYDLNAIERKVSNIVK